MARVTVLMPVYNVEKYIKEAIDSILNQTFKDFILLILDDYSTDNTAKIISEYTDPRIKYYKQDKNVGLSENLNTGVALADTEYLARMDGDDISVATCLEKQINFLDTHADIDICSVGFQFFGAKNSTVIFPENHEDIKVQHLFGCSVIQPMFRRSLFINNKLKYKTEAFPAEDYMMWAEALKVGKAYTIQEVLFYYRSHPDQISTEKRENQITKSNLVRLFMLEWLSTNFTYSEKEYIVESFLTGSVSNLNEFNQLIYFSNVILEKNKLNNKFCEKALIKRFKKHFYVVSFNLSHSLYFQEKYSLNLFLKFLLSGLAKYFSVNVFFKVLVKSMLCVKLK